VDNRSHISTGSVLSIYPASKGFGWAYHGINEEGSSYYQSGFLNLRGFPKEGYNKRVGKLIKTYCPQTLVTRTQENIRSKGIVTVLDGLRDLSYTYQIPHYSYGNIEVKEFFREYTKPNRVSIAYFLRCTLKDGCGGIPELSQNKQQQGDMPLTFRYNAVFLLVFHLSQMNFPPIK
jgi:hypothetical protein